MSTKGTRTCCTELRSLRGRSGGMASQRPFLLTSSPLRQRLDASIPETATERTKVERDVGGGYRVST